MEIYELPFGQIKILQQDMAEVIINHGIELNLDMVNQFHHLLLSELTSPFSLLINKLNDYTYDFDAQQNIGNITGINAIAVISYSRIGSLATQCVVHMIKRKNNINVQLFSNRDVALKWLTLEQFNINQQQQFLMDISVTKN